LCQSVIPHHQSNQYIVIIFEYETKQNWVAILNIILPK